MFGVRELEDFIEKYKQLSISEAVMRDIVTKSDQLSVVKSYFIV